MLFEGKSHYIIPGNNFLIDGFQRSLIYDLQRVNYDILPKELSLAIQDCTSNSFADLFSRLDEEDLDFYKPFIADLVDKDYLIPIDDYEVGNFEKMSLERHFPHAVSNAIIEYSRDSPFELKIALDKLEQLNCQAIEIRFTESHDKLFYQQLRDIIDGMIFRHVDLFIKYEHGQESDFLFQLKGLIPVFLTITQYDAPVDETLKIGDKPTSLKRKKAGYVDLTEDSEVYHRNFYITSEFFLEALQYNSFYHGKIIILKDGTISSNTLGNDSFGLISEVDLVALVKNPAFTELWNVSKDNIKVCKDCEYRYMCHDSRIPSKSESGEWEYKTDCNYDPYTCKWRNVE